MTGWLDAVLIGAAGAVALVGLVVVFWWAARRAIGPSTGYPEMDGIEKVRLRLSEPVAKHCGWKVWRNPPPPDSGMRHGFGYVAVSPRGRALTGPTMIGLMDRIDQIEAGRQP